MDKVNTMNTPTINSRFVKCYSTSMRSRIWRILGGHNRYKFEMGNMATVNGGVAVANLLLKNSIFIFTSYYLRNFWPSSCLSSSFHIEHPINNVKRRGYYQILTLTTYCCNFKIFIGIIYE